MAGSVACQAGVRASVVTYDAIAQASAGARRPARADMTDPSIPVRMRRATDSLSLPPRKAQGSVNGVGRLGPPGSSRAGRHAGAFPWGPWHAAQPDLTNRSRPRAVFSGDGIFERSGVGDVHEGMFSVGGASGEGQKAGHEDVVDAEFEEVKDDKK